MLPNLLPILYFNGFLFSENVFAIVCLLVVQKFLVPSHSDFSQFFPLLPIVFRRGKLKILKLRSATCSGIPIFASYLFEFAIHHKIAQMLFTFPHLGGINIQDTYKSPLSFYPWVYYYFNNKQYFIIPFLVYHYPSFRYFILVNSTVNKSTIT